MSSNNTPSALEQLKEFTKVVADTGDFQTMREFRPQDATTNPSLILKAVQKPEYASLLDGVLAEAGSGAELEGTMDRLLIEFGMRILEIVPGRVSTEVDARLSFDTEGTVNKARELIALYEARGISRDRILIKIASTWEGIEAARILKQEGIRCNMTLLFCLAQAVAAAEAGVQLISPFVGRITDWYKANGTTVASAADDPGVASVRSIFSYYKAFGYETEVMGASFRTIDQIIELAGCDLLTISPALLGELAKSDRRVERKLGAATSEAPARLDVSESNFRWLLNEDAMATQKLAEGIRSFAADIVELEKLIAPKLS